MEHKETKHKEAFTRPPKGLETGLQGAHAGFIMRFEDSEMKAEDTGSRRRGSVLLPDGLTFGLLAPDVSTQD